ncbi:hypothetical protein GCM10009603_08240 [Nocardiopsis exhalans]
MTTVNTVPYGYPEATSPPWRSRTAHETGPGRMGHTEENALADAIEEGEDEGECWDT